MFKSTITAALRNLAKGPLFSVINIGGLALGISVCILAYLYVQRELTWDNWVVDAENLYRVEIHYDFNGNQGYMTNVFSPLKHALDDEVPGIQMATRVNGQSWTVKQGDVLFYENVTMVDPEFLDLFSLNFVSGTAEGALRDLNSIVLSESLARKYFGARPALGETLTVDSRAEFVVRGVYEDLPENTDLSFDVLVRFDESLSPYLTDWNSSNSDIYVRPSSAAAIPGALADMQVLIDKYRPFMGPDEEEPNERMQFLLQRFSDIHLKSNGRSEGNPYGNLAFVWGYIAIAALILGISCVNYINLSTARAIRRTKEVCLRKVAGARRTHLVAQFLGETMVIATLSLLVAMGLVELALPWLRGIVGGELDMALGSDAGLWGILIGLVLVAGLSAGFYPAIYISRFAPAKFLHANNSGTSAGSRLRNGLVFVQFSIAIGLIISAAVIFDQMRFTTALDLGFDKENVIILRGSNGSTTRDRSDALKAELMKMSGVLSVARAYDMPGDGRFSSRSTRIRTLSPEEAPSLRIIPSERNFLEALRVDLVAGRYLGDEFSTDELVMREGDGDSLESDNLPSANAIINETAVTKLGFDSPGQILGEDVTIFMGYGDGGAVFTVVGVVRDVHFGWARQEIAPTIFYHQARRFDAMAVRVADGALPRMLSRIDNIWQLIYPDVPVRRDILAERVERAYEADNRKMLLFLGFASMAVLLSCLGLFGLGVFAAEARTKEIGVRKVMGARSRDIVLLLTMQFSKPVVLANFVAWPAAWYFSNQWLESFVYRVPFGISYFLGAGFLALLIGWLTVGSHALIAARARPIRSLRYE